MLRLVIFSRMQIPISKGTITVAKRTDRWVKEVAFKFLRFKKRIFSCLDQSVRDPSLPSLLKDKVREYLLEDALQQNCTGLQSECQVEVKATCGDPAPLLSHSDKALYSLYSPNQVLIFIPSCLTLVLFIIFAQPARCSLWLTFHHIFHLSPFFSWQSQNARSTSWSDKFRHRIHQSSP